MKKYLFLFTFFLLSSQIYSQSFTRVEYNFEENPSSRGENANFKLTSLAANGYGQWGAIVTEDNTYAQWVLYGNNVTNEQLSNPPVPSGIVAKGNLFLLDQNFDHENLPVKVAANLKGSVRYVWPKADRTGFNIAGFNDNQIATPGVAQINSTFLQSGGQSDLPKPNRSIIKSPIQIFPVVPALYAGLQKKIVASDYELFEDDQYDIAIDRNYLYIVWETRTPNGPGVFLNELFVTVVNLTTGVQVTGFPKQLTSLGTGNGINVDGRRPTISCDVRNGNGVVFDVAFIDKVDPVVQGYVHHVWYERGTTGEQTLPNTMQGTSGISTYMHPTHARIVTSSVRQPVPRPVKAVYIIEDGNLMFHRITQLSAFEPNAILVDGPDPLLPAHAVPILNGALLNPKQYWKVIDDPVRAFANPYDGEAADSYDDFFCLYQLDIPQGVPNNKPLLIVRGWNGGNDTRRCINQSTTHTYLPDPNTAFGEAKEQFVGAANQMGIHVHWLNSQTHYYSRDVRKFDEAIEENTLATYKNYVASGTSHGGSSIPTIQNGKTLTMWTDPFVGVSSTSNGLFVPAVTVPASWHNARIELQGSAKLQIGDGTTGNSAQMVVLPNFEFKFTSGSQELVVKQNSTLHYFGIPSSQLGKNFIGVTNADGNGGTIRLVGGTVTMSATQNGYPITLANPAKLVVHGGANFLLPSECAFVSDNSLITLAYEQDLTPADGTTTNSNATGKMTLAGITTLTQSQINSTQSSTAEVIRVTACESCSTRTLQFSATNNLFQNISGRSELVFDGVTSTKSYKNAVVSGGKFDGFRINAKEPAARLDNPSSPTEPLRLFTIYHTEFNNFGDISASGDPSNNTAISLRRDVAAVTPSRYQSVNIQNNLFKNFSTDDATGVYIEGFTLEDSLMNFRVEENDFTQSTNIPIGGRAKAAIMCENSTVTVLSNQITGTGYKNGIINTTVSASSISNTFICSNDISGCSNNGAGAGILTSAWKGYSKLNNISSCDIGHLSGEHDDAKFIQVTIEDCDGAGLKLSHVDDAINLKGVPATFIDEYTTKPGYAGSNSFIHNNTSSNAANNGQIFLKQYSVLLLGNNTGDYDYGGNNIIGNNSTDNLIYSDASGKADLGHVTLNFWSGGSSPYTAYYLASTSSGNFSAGYDIDARLPNCKYRNQSQSSDDLFVQDPINCGFGFTQAAFNTGDNENSHSLSVSKAEPVTIDECERLLDAGSDFETVEQYAKANDTLRHFIETCPNSEVGNGAWHAFTKITGSVQFMSDDPLRWPEYRKWLLSVLYLNLVDPHYYCADVAAILSTFQFVPGRGYDDNGNLSVLKYIYENNKCPDYFTDLGERWKEIRRRQYQHWQDTVTVDTNLYKMDTTLPSLEGLGLELLRGPNAGVGIQPSKYAGPVLLSVTASNNPFKTSTSISVELGRISWLKYELFNELGQVMWSNPKGEILEKGTHELDLKDFPTLPKGMYYLRVSADGNEAKTLKLRKE